MERLEEIEGKGEGKGSKCGKIGMVNKKKKVLYSIVYYSIE